MVIQMVYMVGKSLSINMSSYKRIRVYYSSNIRRFQGSFDIDLEGIIDTYRSPNKYYGEGLIGDAYGDNTVLFGVTCSVSSNKQTFYNDCMFIKRECSGIDERNDNSSYQVTKIYGLKC